MFAVALERTKDVFKKIFFWKIFFFVGIIFFLNLLAFCSTNECQSLEYRKPNINQVPENHRISKQILSYAHGLKVCLLLVHSIAAVHTSISRQYTEKQRVDGNCSLLKFSG